MKITRPKSKQPIPAHAKKVFQGEIFDVWEWPQKMYDGTIKTFEKIKRPDTARIIPITSDGKIILAKESQPGQKASFGAIGGRIDKNEKPLQAAKRELLEETGYSAKEWILFGAIRPVVKMEWIIYYFIAKDCKKIDKQHLEGGEKIKLLYVRFTEFLDIILKQDEDTYLKTALLEAKLDPKKMQALKRLFGLK